MTRPADFAFIHGGAQGGWVWAETIAALNMQDQGEVGRTLALDAPGCGTKRERTTDTLTLEDVARELVADIENAAMAKVVLVGHSQGGQVMSLMTAMRPGLFRRLVYVSCSIPLPSQTVQEMMGSGLHGSNPNEVGWPFDPRTESIGERYPLMFCNDMNEKQTTALMKQLGRDMWPLATYAYKDWRYDHHGVVPASYVACLRDNILPLSWQEIFAERFRAARKLRIDAGHQAMVSRPHTLAEILRHELD